MNQLLRLYCWTLHKITSLEYFLPTKANHPTRLSSKSKKCQHKKKYNWLVSPRSTKINNSKLCSSLDPNSGEVIMLQFWKEKSLLSYFSSLDCVVTIVVIFGRHAYTLQSWNTTSLISKYGIYSSIYYTFFKKNIYFFNLWKVWFENQEIFTCNIILYSWNHPWRRQLLGQCQV